ncbi:MAG: AAA family ATPase [Candidatus Wallbacteria bacterium]|nr:AAA family ATPase [Candidatus Wallbacteria bacterium]
MRDQNLLQIVNKLVSKATSLKCRKIVFTIISELDRNPEIKVIRGLRGVGKTTVLLQILNSFRNNGFYFSADWPQVRSTSLYDFIVELLKDGFKMICVDEIHTYPNWEQDLKAVSDQFSGVILLVSGSAPAVFSGDRREKIYELEPMDFSEYLLIKKEIVLNAGDSWNTAHESAEITANHFPEISGWFSDYYHSGAFPISLEQSAEDTLNSIFTGIQQSLWKDAASFLKISSRKILAMEKLLYFLATSHPGEFSITSICGTLELSKSSVYEIVSAMERMKLIRVIKPYASGGKLVRGEPKILFTHPNLRVAICHKLGFEAKIGSIREELALFAFKQRGFSFYTVKGLKKSPDYLLKKGKDVLYVEIGGENKNRKQLKSLKNSILIQENQLTALALNNGQ